MYIWRASFIAIYFIEFLRRKRLLKLQAREKEQKEIITKGKSGIFQLFKTQPEFNHFVELCMALSSENIDLTVFFFVFIFLRNILFYSNNTQKT